MDSIILNLNQEMLLDLMKNFYVLTNMKIALFDFLGNEILSYPQEHCAFCSLIRSSEAGECFCQKSNQKSFERCQKTQKLEVYRCHAGLIESTAPLIDQGQVIGYIMFGQITDIADQNALSSMLTDTIKKLHLHHTGYDAGIYKIPAKSQEQIKAASKILEACTFYVLLNDLIRARRNTFVQNLNSFLLAHIQEDLSVDRLTKEFHLSKNKLYDSCNRFLSVGIAEHIRKLRMEEAKRLLKETDLPVYVISDKVGFHDYNYFCRIFKRMTGISAKKYRMNDM